MKIEGKEKRAAPEPTSAPSSPASIKVNSSHLKLQSKLRLLFTATWRAQKPNTKETSASIARFLSPPSRELSRILPLVKIVEAWLKQGCKARWTVLRPWYGILGNASSTIGICTPHGRMNV
jgi:hypothetical protein